MTLLNLHLDVEAYRAKQAGKLARMDDGQLAAHDARLRAALVPRIRSLGLRPGTAVCLGARAGAEVQAFLDVGWFAVGIDLATTPAGAAYVLTGDMHHLIFPAASVDAIYTNIIYDARDRAQLLEEIRRVLKPGGSLLTDMCAMEPHPVKMPTWRLRLGCASLDAFVVAMQGHGWTLRLRVPFTEPWTGEAMLWGPCAH